MIYLAMELDLYTNAVRCSFLCVFNFMWVKKGNKSSKIIQKNEEFI